MLTILIKKVIPMVSAVCLLTACSSVNSDENKSEVLEPIYSLSATADNIEISVKSHGCTKPEHFRFSVKAESGVNEVSIWRTQPDRCRRMPMIETVVLTNPMPGLTGSEFLVKNAFKMRETGR